jgi:hypothetical protein
MGQLETRRLEFQTLLEGVLTSAGVTDGKVYFQPPENLKMSYPCIVYHRQYLTKIHADNQQYLLDRQYRVVYIDRKPNSDVLDAILALPYSRYMSHSNVDGLNHDAFEIYY